MSTFEGLGVAMVTPFQPHGAIDFAALERLTNYLVSGGVDYLVVQGTTGESPVLSAEEKSAVLDCIATAAAGRVPLVFGIGGNNTRSVCDQLERFHHSAVTGVLSVSPAYNKPTQAGIVAHYRAVATATDLPIILYNVPGRTASNVSAETTLEVAHAVDNIVAVKEASGNLAQIESIIGQAPEGFAVLSGDDGLSLPILALGGKGVISVVGNAYPSAFAGMIQAVRGGNLSAARSIHYQLKPLMDSLFVEGNPAGIKAVLAAMGICQPQVRLPLLPASSALMQNMESMVDALSGLEQPH